MFRFKTDALDVRLGYRHKVEVFLLLDPALAGKQAYRLNRGPVSSYSLYSGSMIKA